MNNWVTEELKTADLGDKRLNKRLSVIVEGLASKPDKTIPQTFFLLGFFFAPFYDI
ncbi:IS4/Tn5 family transposase DNA-binding protein [Gloeothece verrucosa]|uniref:IS4/Tn5 family transposase DNA-binding protein n=1 Tax=Gloeothece verrucosa TaxID=2546359 RepID=UPI00030FB412|nr:transposase [Gloeothece verrucosa]